MVVVVSRQPFIYFGHRHYPLTLLCSMCSLNHSSYNTVQCNYVITKMFCVGTARCVWQPPATGGFSPQTEFSFSFNYHMQPVATLSGGHIISNPISLQVHCPLKFKLPDSPHNPCDFESNTSRLWVIFLVMLSSAKCLQSVVLSLPSQCLGLDHRTFYPKYKTWDFNVLGAQVVSHLKAYFNIIYHPALPILWHLDLAFLPSAPYVVLYSLQGTFTSIMFDTILTTIL